MKTRTQRTEDGTVLTMVTVLIDGRDVKLTIADHTRASPERMAGLAKWTRHYQAKLDAMVAARQGAQ